MHKASLYPALGAVEISDCAFTSLKSRIISFSGSINFLCSSRLFCSCFNAVKLSESSGLLLKSSPYLLFSLASMVDPLKLMFTLIAIMVGVMANGWQEPVEFSTATAINCGTASYASKILENHNVHRRNHSAGDLVWDNTLASYAETLARRCSFQHDTYVFHTSSHRRKGSICLTFLNQKNNWRWWIRTEPTLCFSSHSGLSDQLVVQRRDG
jgi:hypothetical protein